MEIEERRVLRRKVPLLEAYLRLNTSTLKSLRDQGLIDREISRAILKLKTRKEKMEYLVQILDEHATPTTFDKICYYLEKEFLDVIADEMQVELQLERGKLPLAEYAVKEAKLLAYKLVADYEQLAEEDLENIASVLAARYVVARETAKRQKARTVKEEDQDMKSIQEDVTQMYEELQGFFNPMLGFGMGGEENDGGSESGFGFTDGFADTEISKEPSTIINGSEPVTEAEFTRSMMGNYYTTPEGKSATSSKHSINGEHGDSYGSTDLLRGPDARTTQDGLSPISEDMRNGQFPAETPLPADARERKDTKEQKKSFMKVLNERMKTLSENLQVAVKNYHKLVRERNSCLEVLGITPLQDGQTDHVSLEEEIKKVIEETGYEPKTENDEDKADDDSRGSYGRNEEKRSRRSYRRSKSNDGEEMEGIEERDDEDEENDSPSELKEKLQEERDKVEQLEEKVDYYKEQLEQMSKTRQMGYLYLSWYDEMVMNQALQPPGLGMRPVYSANNSMVPDRPRSGKPPIALRRVDSAGAGRGHPASTGHSTHSARGPRGGTRWVYYNPDFLEVGDGYVTLKTDQLPHAWSRETTPAGDGRNGREGRPSSAEHRQGSPRSPQGQPSRSSNPTPGQNKRFNSPDFKLPPTGQSGNMTGAPTTGGYVSGDASPYSSRGNKGGKSVRISSGDNRVYNAHSLDSQY